MSKSFDKLGKSVNNSFKGLFKTAGLAIGLASLVKLGKTAIKTASDLEEIQNVVDVVFGQSANEINTWAKTTLKSFGLVESEAKDIASTFKAMSNGMGITDDAGKAMSIRLTELSADLASFRNSTTEITSRALSGVFTGETEALKRFGIVMTDTNLKAFALAQGIKKDYSAMSQAEKVALRYQFVMQATADAQGDFARSSNSWANQMRVLRGQWVNFLGVLGTGIKQILSPLLSVLNNILASIITITKNLLSLLGIDFSTTSAQVSSAASGVEDIATGLDDASGSAKKLNKEIAGFDELETIGKSSGIGDLAEELAGAASDLDITMPEISEDEVRESMFGSFREAMQVLKSWFEEKMDPWLEEKSTKFAGWVNETFGDEEDWALAGSTVGAGLTGIIHAVDRFFTDLDGYNVGKSLGTFFNSLTTEIDWESLGHGWGEKLKDAMDVAIGFLETYNWTGLGKSTAKMIDAMPWKDIGTRLATLISDMLLAAMDFAIGLSTGHLGENVSNFIDGWAEGWKGEELKKKFLEEFKPAMKEAWDELWSSLEDNEYVGGLVKTLEELAVTLKQILEILLPLAAALKGFEIIAGIFTALNTGIPILGMLSDKIMAATMSWSGFVVEANGSVTLWNFLAGTFTALREHLASMVGGLVSSNAELAALNATIVGIVTGIVALVAALVHAYRNNEEFRQSVDSFVAALKTHVADIIQQLKEFYEQHFKPLVDSVINLIKMLLNVIVSHFSGWWDWFSNFIAGMVSFLLPIIDTIVGIVSKGVTQTIDILGDIFDILSGIIDFITGIFTGDISRALDGVTRIFTGFINGLEDLGNAFKNIFIAIGNVILSIVKSVVNGAITALNKIHIKIPDWVPGLGGKSWGFNLSKWPGYQIPYLAKGGVIDNPTVAMLGEYAGARQNPEIAAPESMIRDIIVSANGDMVSAFYQMATQIIQAIDNVDMNVQIGDETIAKSAKRGSDQYYKMTGKPMFAY